MKTNKLAAVVAWFSSPTCTLLCLALTIILVAAGTIAQVYVGTFIAQRLFFSSFFIYYPIAGLKLPVFIGGLSLGFLWLLALLASFYKYSGLFLRRPGLLMAHLGILVLLLGQGYTQLFSEETNLAIEVGQTSNYSESRSKQELAFSLRTNDRQEDIFTLPVERLAHQQAFASSNLPFTIIVKRFYRNSAIERSAAGATPLASRGIGTQVVAQELPVSRDDDMPDSAAAYIELVEQGKSLGTWLVSADLNRAQQVFAAGKSYAVELRQRRTYLPFSLTLKKFSHDVYPGTQIPKNFSSLVELNNPAKHEQRDVLIYMNHPLRYAGLAFYQASFGKNDTLSVLQVVRNPGWLVPYISCILVTLGLVVEFLRHYLSFSKLRRRYA